VNDRALLAGVGELTAGRRVASAQHDRREPLEGAARSALEGGDGKGTRSPRVVGESRLQRSARDEVADDLVHGARGVVKELLAPALDGRAASCVGGGGRGMLGRRCEPGQTRVGERQRPLGQRG
jgi:hypothetical protein